jgi:sugar O-acyltransferase (sialic acid O-acetyltransferase NeuD family)
VPFVSAALADHERAVFIDDADLPSTVNGYPCLKWPDFLELESSQRLVCLAIADGTVREKLDKKCIDAGVSYFSPRSNQTIIMDDVQIGEGAILSPYVTITSNIRIGRHFHANLYSYVEHDCIIGDFVTFAPGVKCNGNVVIEDFAYIGTGAILRQGTPGKPLVIGEGAVVGMGAVVTKSVSAGTTVVGNPARPLEKD